MSRATFAAALALAACTYVPSEPRTMCIARPLAGEPAVEAVELADGRVRAVGDRLGTAADGRARVSVRARGVDGCAVAVRVVLRPAGAAGVAREGGTLAELVVRDAGGEPRADDPLAWIELPVVAGASYDLGVAIEDVAGVTAVAWRRVDVPR